MLQKLEDDDHARRASCIAAEMRIQAERVKMLQMYGKLPQSGTPLIALGLGDDYEARTRNMSPTEIDAELARVEAEILKRAGTLPKALRQLSEEDISDAEVIGVEDGVRD